jgi:glutamine amidotransferase
MLTRIGVEAQISASPEQINKADKLILPGVGAFDHAMRRLNESGLIPVLAQRVLIQRVPILGICLGMQLFSERSEEGKLPGLGWLDADTVRFKFNELKGAFKIPHMGWDTVNVQRANSIFEELPHDARFYFVHSYHVACRDESNILTTTDYGGPFASTVIKNNIIGMQFHPEKSHRFGMHVLTRFVQRFTGSLP